MKRNSITILLVAVLVLISCNNTNTSKNASVTTKAEKELIFDRGNKIDSPNFTGDAWLNNLITPEDENRNAVGSVTFSPGSRTSWHSHPAGQIILALNGIGYYQEKGKPVEIIRKGEVVKCPHNIPHWHGASPDSEFIQVAITGRENGPTVWMEPVTDEEYDGYNKD
ncbi:MAG: cupin domain-containing protein [Bacteroides sp.]|nr:cupin domain-containing protein [Bacteroides sp.]